MKLIIVVLVALVACASAIDVNELKAKLMKEATSAPTRKLLDKADAKDAYIMEKIMEKLNDRKARYNIGESKTEKVHKDGISDKLREKLMTYPDDIKERMMERLNKGVDGKPVTKHEVMWAEIEEQYPGLGARIEERMPGIHERLSTLKARTEPKKA